MCLRYFNPRSREGSDEGQTKLSQLTRISIHAPVKGATWKKPIKVQVVQFQSTLP